MRFITSGLVVRILWGLVATPWGNLFIYLFYLCLVLFNVLLLCLVGPV